MRRLAFPVVPLYTEGWKSNDFLVSAFDSNTPILGCACREGVMTILL